MRALVLILASILINYVDADFSEAERFDCFPEGGNQTLCEARGCQWLPSKSKGVPPCFYKQGFQAGYELVGNPTNTNLGYKLNLKRISYSSIYGDDIENVTLDVEFQTENRIRFKFYDPSKQRYEVPISMPTVQEKSSSTNYDVLFVKNKPFAMQIIRKETKAVLWDSSVGLFVFSDQFLQLSTKTASSYVYGIGEQEHTSFRHKMNWKTWPIFTRDQFPFNGGNAYGHHVFHMCLEEDGKSYGVFLLNSNAMEMVLQPLPAITYRTIGGILDFYLFLGPTPEAVVSQYTESIGRPLIPPYWSLGFQLSRWGYNSLKRVKEVVNGMRKYDIPQDVQYGDIDYMVRQLDFTYDPDRYAGLPHFVRSAKKDGLRYIIILDPAIGANETKKYNPYESGSNMDIWVKDVHGKPLFGKVWPTFENVIVNSSLPWDEQTRLYRQWATFPDYFQSKAEDWWGDHIKEFYKEVEFDALWIDMNEPANFVHGAVNGCPDTKWDYPPYKPKSVYGAVLADKTLCMSARHAGNRLHYDLHSLYGYQQSIVTDRILKKLLNKRSLVLSRSTFAGSGKYAGHWLGDNVARWDQLHASIIGMLEFNFFGIPYVGADVCGFFDHPSPEMCERWTQLGSFYPFSRNHNGFGNAAQDPASFGPEFAKSARKVLRTRYTLLPYLYTLFYESRRTGATVVRSLMAEFTSDKTTWDIDRQFLWGPALLISPVLDKGKTSVEAYFPDARWYDYYTGKELSRRKALLTLDAPLDHINLHVRGGHVIPTQEPANNTMFSRKNKMGLIVALCGNHTAKGRLFWDDGESIGTFENGNYLLVVISAQKNTVELIVSKSGYAAAKGLVWSTVKIYGTGGNKLYSATANSVDVTSKSSISSTSKVLTIKGLDLDITKSHEIKWDVTSVPASALALRKSWLTMIAIITLFVVLKD